MNAPPSSRSPDGGVVGVAHYAALGLAVAARLRPGLLAELERLIRTFVSEQDWPAADAVARGEMRLREFDAEFHEAIGYAAGRAYERAVVDAEEAEARMRWSRVLVDHQAWLRSNPIPWAERRRRELEWAKPKPGDYTGQLTEAEYFGAEAPASAVEGLRAA